MKHADKKLWIIGVAGTNGAGKDTVGQVMAKHHNYLFVSVTELLRNECRRRKLPVERENLRMISAEWRRELGLGVLVDKAVAEFEAGRDKYSGVVISSIRNPGEADRVHELGGTMLWIDAAARVRYDRVQNNRASRGDRAGEDKKTFEQFLAEEQAEMHRPDDGDAATLDVSAVKDRCDVIIDNSQEDLTTFGHHIEHVLGLKEF
ncbi:MAG TPA: AAA family ATPase [Candidatus Saccharimonadales bacterium]|nr:AAA family ATPase [Candidatus Saccharimonadales bacterium]